MERYEKMETTIKFDKVVLIKELDDKIKKVGEMFEIANILDGSFLLRDAKTKVALGVVSFEDFEKHFVHAANFKGWTDWQPITGFDGQTDAYYKTNRKKVMVKFLTHNVRAESCCSSVNDFNLSFGIQLAYLRCLNKAWAAIKSEYEAEIKAMNSKLAKAKAEIVDNERIIESMIHSLPA